MVDPHSGKVYSEAEAKLLPPEIRQRLIPVPRPVKRQKRTNRKAKTYEMPDKKVVKRRRKASKQAKLARKKNRK